MTPSDPNATRDGAYPIGHPIASSTKPPLTSENRPIAAGHYEAYRQTCIEQDRHGAFPLVVWSITHPDPAKAERRRQALADAIAADRTLTAALFRIVAPDALLPLIGNGGAV
jgi:hypothetical protein